MRRSAPGASARVRRRRRRAGRAGGGTGKRSWHHHSQGPASRAATPVARERASALQRHLALLLQAAEDGVGDLHPLGIGIVAVGQDHQAQVAARDERHVGAEAVGGAGLVQQALALQRLWRVRRRSCAVAAPSASSCRPAGASGRSASRRLPAQALGHVADLVVTAMGGIERLRPGLSRRSGCRLASTKRSRSAALVFTP